MIARVPLKLSKTLMIVLCWGERVKSCDDRSLQKMMLQNALTFDLRIGEAAECSDDCYFHR